MGRFARHCAIVDADKAVTSNSRSEGVVEDTCTQYRVKYNEVALMIKAKTNAEQFRVVWKQELTAASQDFDRQLTKVWSDILNEIKKENESSNIDILQKTGALPSQLFAMYIDDGYEGASCLLQRFVDLQKIALFNSEALRKLVRKFDKQTGLMEQSIGVLPMLYTASFTVALQYLAHAIETLRELMQEEEELMSSDLSTASLSSSANKGSVPFRAEEAEWFRDSCAVELTRLDLQTVVAHRGFHNVNDESDNRPLENTLASFEQVWTAGVYLCECDIAMSKDEKIVMAHDECFQRLALCDACDSSFKRVSDMTLRELMSLNLKSGNRPPLLVDCLRSAAAIGEQSKLVVEIKPGNSEIVTPLARLFTRHRDLLSHVDVIMSFDSHVMHELGTEFAIQNIFQMQKLGQRKSLLSMKGFSSDSRRSLRGIHSENDVNIMKRGQYRKREGSVSYPSVEQNSMNYKPKFMLITQHSPSNKFCVVSVNDFSPIDKWLSDYNVDGVYLEYEDAMLDYEGREAMIELSDKCTVGVWMYAGRDPDRLSICRRLVEECGVSYVNTDFPRNFFYT